MKFLATALAGLLLWTNPVVAQAPDPSPTGHSVEIHLRERWLHGRQRPEFKPWSEPSPEPLLYVESVSAAGVPGARALAA